MVTKNTERERLLEEVCRLGLELDELRVKNERLRLALAKVCDGIDVARKDGISRAHLCPVYEARDQGVALLVELAASAARVS